MKLRPTYDNVIVEREESETRTKLGIIIPDTAKTKTNRGDVIAVGPGRYHEGKLLPPPCKVGDRVMFLAFAGSQVELDEKVYLMLASKDIIAVLE